MIHFTSSRGYFGQFYYKSCPISNFSAAQSSSGHLRTQIKIRQSDRTRRSQFLPISPSLRPAPSRRDLFLLSVRSTTPMPSESAAAAAPPRPRCVRCGSAVPRLYLRYSPGNIRLIKCDKCKAVADPYIECEFMIILIDLILHKVEAYRHLLFNMLSLDSDAYKGILSSSVLAYVFLDAYELSFLNGGELDSSNSLLSAIWFCAKILGIALAANLVFMILIFAGLKFFLKISYNIKRYKEVISAIVISSYLKLFLLSTMVWESPLSVIHIVNIFVLSSNIVALRVVSQPQAGWCVGICCLAHAAKILIGHWLLELLHLSSS